MHLFGAQMICCQLPGSMRIHRASKRICSRISFQTHPHLPPAPNPAHRLPVQWEKTTIVVLDEVRVSSPYLPDNVKGGAPALNDRVKKVLELERKRLQARISTQ